MGRRKREPMSEGKKNITGMLLEEYEIRSVKDIEDTLKDLFGENENVKYWHGVLNELKNRNVKEILDTYATAFPKKEYVGAIIYRLRKRLEQG